MECCPMTWAGSSYNTVDASLWFVRACVSYYQHSKDGDNLCAKSGPGSWR